jgi:hypothetical protein
LDNVALSGLGATKIFDGLLGPALANYKAIQTKLGQYLQAAKKPRSICQTEKAVELEQGIAHP